MPLAWPSPRQSNPTTAGGPYPTQLRWAWVFPSEPTPVCPCLVCPGTSDPAQTLPPAPTVLSSSGLSPLGGLPYTLSPYPQPQAFSPCSYLPSAASLSVASPGGFTLQASSLLPAKDSASSWANPDLSPTLSPGIPELISPNPSFFCFLPHRCSSLNPPGCQSQKLTGAGRSLALYHFSLHHPQRDPVQTYSSPDRFCAGA